ncbi:MAG: extracellular solute-binding protein [Thermomicrobiales bacterium]
MPWLGNAQFFVSRPEWLARLGLESPTDWNETVEFATKIGNAFGDEELAGFAIESLTAHQVMNSFLPILRGFGSELIDPQTMVPQLDTSEAIAAAEVFQALAALSPVESAATGEPTNTERFESGTVAMMANFWSSGVLASSSAEMEWESGPIASNAQPAQQSVPRQTMTGAWLAGIPAGSLQAARAREFIDWLTSTRVQISLIGSLLPPANSAAYADDASIDAQPELPHLLELLAGSTPRPRSPYYPQLELLAATELIAMLAGELSAEEALRNANLAMRAFLAREGVLDA